MIHLCKQARHCNFGETLNENLQDEVTEKLPDIELKKKLLEVNNITLEVAMDKVRKWGSFMRASKPNGMPSQELGAGTNGAEETSGRGSK